MKLGWRLELALGVRIRARLGPSWIGFRLGPILMTVTVSGWRWSLEHLSLVKQLGAGMKLDVLMLVWVWGAFPYVLPVTALDVTRPEISGLTSPFSVPAACTQAAHCLLATQLPAAGVAGPRPWPLLKEQCVWLWICLWTSLLGLSTVFWAPGLLCHFSLSDAGMSGTVSGGVVAGSGWGNVTRTPAREFLIIRHHLIAGGF